MGKFCLPAVWLRRFQRLGSVVLLLGLAGMPTYAASNRASAVLHIQVTVVPTVQTTTSQPTVASPTGSVAYNLQPPTAPKMTSLVTVQPVSTSGTTSGLKSSDQSGKGAVLQTTTVIAE
ncbi:MAG TPA: hypothetical protein VJU82_13335 [Acidobacteriaceae bacterium]|nr:hypothetical protein [Acidobacteriaceae bacterium]